MYRLGFAGLLVALLATVPRPAQAQLSRLSLGAAFGSTHPHGGASAFEAGHHIEGLADLALPLVPIGFRGEIAYDQMGRTTGSSLRVASGILNATFSLPLPLIHPYAIAGWGYYIHNASIGGEREGRFGFNGGAGVELHVSTMRAFAEARYHAIDYGGVNLRMIPVTIGIIF